MAYDLAVLDKSSSKAVSGYGAEEAGTPNLGTGGLLITAEDLHLLERHIAGHK